MVTGELFYTTVFTTTICILLWFIVLVMVDNFIESIFSFPDFGFSLSASEEEVVMLCTAGM